MSFNLIFLLSVSCPTMHVSYSPSHSTQPPLTNLTHFSAQIKYKTLSWPLVSILMIAEIVSNGMLSLPSSLATVGFVPGLVVIIFLGVFATYTSHLLVSFKLRHPHVHNMGDAGYILAGPPGRELLGAGTVIFAVFATGGQLLAGQIAITSLSQGRLCPVLGALVFAVPTAVGSLPRTLDKLGWLSVPSVVAIAVAGVVGMVGAGLHAEPGREVVVARETSFYVGFGSVTNPVFAYAGHFMFVSSFLFSPSSLPLLLLLCIS